jgi:hypothetical protein
VAPGNAICAEEVSQLNRLKRPETIEQTLVYLPQALAIMRREGVRLAPLDRAGAGRSELTSALTSTRQLTALLGSFMYRLRHGVLEFSELATVQQHSTAMQAKVDASFRQAGLARCVD